MVCDDMTSLIEMRDFLKSQSSQNVELLGITTDSPKRTTSFQMDGGSPVSKDIKTLDLTITTRASHPSESEEDIHEWYNKLNNKTNIQLKNIQIIQIRSISYPTYLGRYENGLFYFNAVFSLLISHTKEI
jgi:hypothetical protein